jgi:hypothetical protein
MACQIEIGSCPECKVADEDLGDDDDEFNRKLRISLEETG